MIEYVFKSAVSLALLYSLFFACLSRETFHRFNRVSLLLIMGGSLVLPLVHLTVSRPSLINEVVTLPATYLAEIPVRVKASTTFSLIWGTLLGYVYLTGAVVVLLVLSVQIWQMIRQMRGGLRHTDEYGNTIILCRGVKSPFSIFHWIVMDVADYEKYRHSILLHEQEHIRQGHTFDLLLLEVMKVFQWFNPFIWFLGHDLKAIHEYEADEAVINHGIDAAQYQQLLVLKAVGNRLQPLANNLRRGSLKQRIIMMYQRKSNRWMMLKALFIIPTVCFALYAFATPETVPEIKKVLKQEVAPVNTMIVLPVDEGSVAVNQNAEETEKFLALINNKVEGRITKVTDQLLVIDGKEAAPAQFEALTSEDIYAVNIFKGEAAMELYGEKGKNGVIQVLTHDGVVDIPEKVPEFPGGDVALYKYISEAIRYPAIAIEVGATGRFSCQFVVERDGSISNIKVIKATIAIPDAAVVEGVGNGKDEGEKRVVTQEQKEEVKVAFEREVVRIIQSMPHWIPGESGGRTVRSQFVIPLTFRIE